MSSARQRGENGQWLPTGRPHFQIVNARMPSELIADFDEAAAAAGVSRSEAMRQAFTHWLAAEKATA